jgi:protein TonB
LEKLQASNKNLITKTPQEKQKVKEQKGKNEEVFTVVENQPEFIGGQTAMIEFLTKNIVYPKAEREKGIQGTVYVTFIVETDGNLSNVKVIRGVNKALDNEAVRVVKLMEKKWKAGTFKGKPVRVQFNLPIKYALEEK